MRKDAETILQCRNVNLQPFLKSDGGELFVVIDKGWDDGLEEWLDGGMDDFGGSLEGELEKRYDLSQNENDGFFFCFLIFVLVTIIWSIGVVVAIVWSVGKVTTTAVGMIVCSAGDAIGVFGIRHFAF